MALLVELGRILGFSFAAGINLYATVAIIGLAARFDWVDLPPQYDSFASTWVIGAAAVLYAIEFAADKVPWLDSVWDTVHTVIRPIGGATIAVLSLGHATPTTTAVSALLGGLVAGSTHLTKAGTRVMANTSPEPFSNWALSLGEDALVVSLGILALRHPLMTLVVTCVLLGLIAWFATAIWRAFRRRGSGRSRVAAGTTVAVLVMLAAAVGSQSHVIAHEGQAQAPTPASGAQAPSEPAQTRPTFRSGANYVRIDAYATKNGEPVTDMTINDFEVAEDGVVQKIESFEHVVVSSGGAPSSRISPRTVAESRQMAADPRARLFVIFLDLPHLKMASGMRVRGPLIRLLERAIGDDDLVAVMTPEMSALDLSFTRRTDQLAAKLQSAAPFDLGFRDRVTTPDPAEEQYQYCYPGNGLRRSAIAAEMIERRREKRSIDALVDVVRHLDGLREERKAILLISEGYLMFRENRLLAEAQTPTNPGVGVNPTGQLGTAGGATGALQQWCDQQRILLSRLDIMMEYHRLLDEANKSNATFYPVDPRGLEVFDSDLGGPDGPVALDVDMGRLRMRQESLEVAALNTDGVAIIQNNIDEGLKRVVADLTSYYLMGYSSTHTKADGRFHTIKVRSKRPGVEIRARRGYRAPTAAELASRVAVEAPKPVDPAAAAVQKAVNSLISQRHGSASRLQVTAGWWLPEGPPIAGKPLGAETALWIYGDIDTKRPGADDWSQGGEADIAILSKTGEELVSYTEAVAPGLSSFVSRFPRNDQDVWLDPGEHAVRVRLKAKTGGLPTTDTVRLEVPTPAAAGTFVLGEALYARRSQATGNKTILTADRSFRRTERLTIDISASAKADSATAELLDRTGKPMPVPLTPTLIQQDGVATVRAELALSALAQADYVIRISAVKGGETRQVLVPFRIVP